MCTPLRGVCQIPMDGVDTSCTLGYHAHMESRFADTQEGNLAFLQCAFTVSVRDPLWKDIPFTRPLEALLHCTSVQQLGRIKQLGPTYHIYPGAVHTRLDHSIGVYHIARLMVMAFLRQEQQTVLTRKGILSFLCAALLHDLGHFPFAHSLKELPLEEHEHLGAQAILGDPRICQCIREAGADVRWVCAIIDEGEPADDPQILCYRNLLSGTLDPDKLDYLNRDAYFCGVPYGVQDVSYIIDRIRLEGGVPALPESAMASVEHLLFSKYLMYNSVYWNKHVRCATAMIKCAVVAALDAGVLQGSDLYNLDDDGFFALASTKEYAPLSLLRDVRDNQLLSCRYEQPFDPANSLHTQAMDIPRRMEMQRHLHAAIAQEYPQLPWYSVIIDIPEPISFEADIQIIGHCGTTVPFSEADGLFSQSVVNSFAKALRKVRIFVPSYVDANYLAHALCNAGLYR